MPSGRLKLTAYSPLLDVTWSREWVETPGSPLDERLETIVAAIESGALELLAGSSATGGTGPSQQARSGDQPAPTAGAAARLAAVQLPGLHGPASDKPALPAGATARLLALQLPGVDFGNWEADPPAG
ncbi:hypothetical protein GCM10007864_10050 [Sinorhizobium fredii]|nr:hypothetical protein GCM10007864_10050 [Sinorhizobium fredii]